MGNRVKPTMAQVVTPLVIVAVCGAGMAISVALSAPVPAGVFCAPLVIALPVFVMAIAGHPVVMSLAPLFPSAESRHLRRNPAAPKLDDHAFYEAFYRDSNIPRSIPIVLRHELEEALGMDLSGLHPADNIALVDDELDFGDVVYRIERVLRIKIPARLAGGKSTAPSSR